jgi:hypothetical protein
MTTIALSGNASGAGAFTIATPSSTNTQTLTLPDATTTLVGTDATQTLTNKTWASPASSTISSGTAVASTSGTSIDFTSIPSWVKRITVMFSSLSTNGTSVPIIQLGDSGGIETTGYLGAAGYGGPTTNAANFTTGFGFNGAHAATAVYQGSATIMLIDASSNTWVYSMTGSYSNSNYTISGGGSKPLSATLDRVRITTVNGTDTFDAGSINILYE